MKALFKKPLAVILAALLLLTAFPLTATAAATAEQSAIASSGTTGDCTWALDDNGTLTIGGGKKLGDYYSNWNGQPWYSFRYKIKSVVIKEGVTGTGGRPFFDCYNLTSVSLPTSLENIGGFTFDSCSKLKSITIPEKVNMIGYYAFYNTALWNTQTGPVYVDNCLVGYNGTAASNTTLQIKNGTKLIANCALVNQKGINNIQMPDSVKFINSSAFGGTGWYLNQPDGLLYIDNYLVETKGKFDTSNQILIKEGTKVIAESIFHNRSENKCDVFTSVYLPKSVKYINDYAFEDCVNLSDVYYSGSQEEWKQIQIGLYGNDCLSSANIHYNYTYVKDEVFKDNSTLTLLKNAQKSGKSILNDYDAGDTAKVIAFDVLTNLFDLAAEQLTVDFGGDAPEEKALDEVTQNIMKDYFGYNGSIEEQKLNSVNEKWKCFKTAVKGIKQLREQKKEAEAKKLAKSTIKQISKKGDTFGDKIINGFSKVSPYIDGAFTYYEIAMTATMLQEFDKATVESLINTFPKNTTACTGLQRLYHDMTISNDQQYIIEKFTQSAVITALSEFLEEVTFQGNKGLKEAYSSASGILSLAYELSGGVTMKDISRARSAEAIAANALSLMISNSDSAKREMLFNFCLSSIKVELENCIKVCKSSSTALKSSAQDYLGKVNKLTYEKYIKNCANEYNNPQGVTFENPDLEKYKISANISTNNKALSPVGANDDDSIINENELIIPSSTEDYLVTSISENGFANLEGITTIYVPDSIEVIGDSAFYNCGDTQSITLGNKVTLIGEKAFMNCSNLSSINLSANLKTIKASAFENCSKLTSAVLGKELSELGDKSFANCESLSTVFVFNPTLVIPDAVFENCENLTIYGYSGSTAEEYANQHNITFESIGDSSTEIIVNFDGEPEVELGGFVNLSDIWLDITYSDGETKTITENFKVACDTSTVGKQNAVVIYGSNYTTFEVDVVQFTPLEICFDKNHYSMIIGDTLSKNDLLSSDSSDYSIAFTSSNDSVVKVVGDSIVAVGEGNAEITATMAEEDLSAKCSVSVGNSRTIDCSDGLFDPVFFVAPCDGNYKFTIYDNNATLTMIDSSGNTTQKESLNGKVVLLEELSGGETYLLFASSPNSRKLIINDNSENGNTSDDVIIDFGSTGDCSWMLDENGVLKISGNGEMDDYFFENAPWDDDIKKVIIEDGVTSIGTDAFSNCKSLTSVTIPNSVVSINQYAFYNCSSLTDISIPDSVTDIGYCAFCNCQNLKSVEIPENVSFIGDYAFGYYSEYNSENDETTHKRITGFTIGGYSCSWADTYATENGFKFVALDASTIIIGDVNDDGSVNGADAGLLSRYASGWQGYADKIKNMDAADINGDSNVNGADAGILSRYASGWKQYDKYFQ